MSLDLIFEVLLAVALVTSVAWGYFRVRALKDALGSIVIHAERAEAELRRIQQEEQSIRCEQELQESVADFEREERVYRTSFAVLKGAVKATGALPVDEDVRSIVRVVRAMLSEIDHPTEAPKEPERLDDSGG